MTEKIVIILHKVIILLNKTNVKTIVPSDF